MEVRKKKKKTKSYSNTVPNLELFPYLGKKSNGSFITPACSNTTKDFSSKLMGCMDLLKAIKYKKNLLLENLAGGSMGIEGFYGSWTGKLLKSRILEFLHERLTIKKT